MMMIWKQGAAKLKALQLERQQCVLIIEMRTVAWLVRSRQSDAK